MEWDYIIVGAGSAGCVIANRLSMDPGKRVLVLEAGGSHRTPLITVPAGEPRVIGNPQYDWCFRTEPDASLNGRTQRWPRGRVLGGSSSINGMMWIRGQREDFDHWAELGNRGWSYRDLLPLFRRSESNDIDDPTFHGRDGPLTVSTISTPHPLTKTFIEAGCELGIPYNPDVNGRLQEGIGPTQGNIRYGRRQSAATAFLDPIRSRSNLTILTRAVVHRVLIENGRAAGVLYTRAGGRPVEVRCTGEVVLSAGTVMSPVLLMRSGIGPADHLRSLGIAVTHDSQGVGQNLQEHSVVWASAFVNVSTYNTELAPHKWIKHGLNWLLFGRGPASTPIAHAAAFVRSSPGAGSPDLQLSFVPTAYEETKNGPRLLDRPAVVIGIYKCRPESKGHIELRSADPSDPPRIFGNVLSEASDLETTVAGLKLAKRFFQTRAFAPAYLDAHMPDGNVSENDYEAYARAVAAPAYHPVGTCKMGSDSMAVVDETLRVRGVRGLRVADASIMPRITSGNTNAPSIMIGEKASDLIRHEKSPMRGGHA